MARTAAAARAAIADCTPASSLASAATLCPRRAIGPTAFSAASMRAAMRWRARRALTQPSASSSEKVRLKASPALRAPAAVGPPPSAATQRAMAACSGAGDERARWPTSPPTGNHRCWNTLASRLAYSSSSASVRRGPPSSALPKMSYPSGSGKPPRAERAAPSSSEAEGTRSRAEPPAGTLPEIAAIASGSGGSTRGGSWGAAAAPSPATLPPPRTKAE
mmetsp:Transcript_14877/g.61908  ORF Transcript_14877/g.61908 Transcript_14877/m.61908 type:complete len:220 (+) Transcript_14877:1395-2054(+)